jgi:hypothetical protein
MKRKNGPWVRPHIIDGGLSRVTHKQHTHAIMYARMLVHACDPLGDEKEAVLGLRNEHVCSRALKHVTNRGPS